MENTDKIAVRFAHEEDIPQILGFIQALAVYEEMLDQVVATEELLREWIFEKKKAEVLLAECEEKPVGFALFFHNFSTFLGRAWSGPAWTGISQVLIFMCHWERDR